jgi:hypothetical protein
VSLSVSGGAATEEDFVEERMKEKRAAGREGIVVMVCSLLMVLQPVLGAQAPASAAGTRMSHGPARVNGAPALDPASAKAMPVAFPRRSLPGPNHDSNLIAVAQLTGTAEKNGRPLVNGSIVFSGDALRTHQDSGLLLAATPEERLWLGPDTSAKVTKDAGKVAVALGRGTLGFQTRGHIEVTFERYGGVAIRSRSDSPALAELSFVNGREAHVQLQKGSLEMIEGKQALLLQPEPSRTISVADAGLTAESDTKQDVGAQVASTPEAKTGSITGTVVGSKLFVVSGANVTLADAMGNTLITVTDQQGHFSFSKVRPGTYTLTVTQKGYRTYQTHDLVVTGGKAASEYVQLSEVGNKHTGLLIGVIAGGGAAAGVGVWAATKKKSPTSSPSVP